MIIILLGAPGAGKGTQSELLQERLNMVHVSSGDLLRDNIKRGTELGIVADTYMVKGDFVPDDLIIDMIVDRLAKPDAEQGVILDGFPRTLTQAAALDDALTLRRKRVNSALFINAEERVLINRLSGRLTCRNCGHVFHTVFAPPQVAGVCDWCGGELYQRDDDKRETAIHRLEKFKSETGPVVEYYRERGLLCEIAGDQPIDKVTGKLLECLR